MNFFLDLDGPILDVSRRHWVAYSEILLSHHETPLPLNQYWSLKRSRTPARTILDATGCAYPHGDFSKEWIDIVETEKYLLHDEPWPGIDHTLARMREIGHRVLVTLRRSRPNLEWELQHFGLDRCLDNVLSSGEQRAMRWEVKMNLILNAGYIPDQGDFMIGDTETDILAGKALGVQTVAVTSGIREAASLNAVGPDFVVDSLYDFVRSQLLPNLEQAK